MAEEIKPAELRQMFNTEAGREAFDRLDALGAPRWVFQQEKDKVYLSPSIEIKKGGMLISTGAGWGANVDDVVQAQEKALRKGAAEPGTLLVTNAYRPTRAEFRYEKERDRFEPLPPKP